MRLPAAMSGGGGWRSADSLGAVATLWLEGRHEG